MSVFNSEKTPSEYKEKALFLGSDKGLLNTIHKHFPRIWDLYKSMKALDWDENEFMYSRCLNEFKSCDKDTADMMIKTLAWQWEADSIAATSPVYLVAPFNPCIEVWESEVAITANEMVHANTYSEIVRMSFEDPTEVLDSILKDQEAIKRVSIIESYLDEFAQFSKDYTNNPSKYTEKYVLANLMLFYFAMLLLERIQFMASFAITFTICRTGIFNAIGQAVKKIAQDELEVHVAYRKEVFNELRNIDNEKYNGEIFDEIYHEMVDMLKSIIAQEMEWTDCLFDGRELIGITANLVKKWVLFNAQDVMNFINISPDELGYESVTGNPLPYLEEWFNMNMSQGSPQEQQLPNYKLNSVVRSDEGEDFDF